MAAEELERVTGSLNQAIAQEYAKQKILRPTGRRAEPPRRIVERHRNPGGWNYRNHTARLIMATTVKCQNCQASFPVVGGGISGSVKCPFCGKMTGVSGAGEASQAPDEQGRVGGPKDEFDVNVTAKVEHVAPPLTPQPPGILAGQADEFDTGQTLRSPVQGNIPPHSQDEFDTGQTMRQQEPVGRPGASAAPARPEAPAATPPQVGELPSGFLLDRRYRITKPCGSGGMGTVYKATDEETEKEYAIKTLRPELTASPTAIADLKKEVAIAQDLTHPNILRINYLGVAGGTVYLVMEYIDGEDLEAFRLGKGGRVTADSFGGSSRSCLPG